MGLLEMDSKFIPDEDVYRKLRTLLDKAASQLEDLKSGSRSQFLGVRRVQEIRDQVGAEYSIITLNEGQEDAGFLDLFKKITS